MTLIDASPLNNRRAARPARVKARCRPPGSRRPGPARPAWPSPRYRGPGVARSTAAHHRRPVTAATTVALALVSALITLWLGLVAHRGGLVGGAVAGTPARIPDRLAVVRVEAGRRGITWRPGWLPARRRARWPTASANSTAWTPPR